MALSPASAASRLWPSTVAYVARLLIHRYAMLGILDRDGYPVTELVCSSPLLARDGPRLMKAHAAASVGTIR